MDFRGGCILIQHELKNLSCEDIGVIYLGLLSFLVWVDDEWLEDETVQSLCVWAARLESYFIISAFFL